MSLKQTSAPASKSSEPLLTENDSRYVLFPIQDNEIWKMYKKQVDCFWRAEEIDLSKDIVEWTSDVLNDNERFFISMIFYSNIYLYIYLITSNHKKYCYFVFLFAFLVLNSFSNFLF